VFGEHQIGVGILMKENARKFQLEDISELVFEDIPYFWTSMPQTLWKLIVTNERITKWLTATTPPLRRL